MRTFSINSDNFKENGPYAAYCLLQIVLIKGHALETAAMKKGSEEPK